MKYADLHVHTFYSDSTFSPEEVVTCAKEKALSAIAICDHDSVDGIEPCEKLGRPLGVEIIPGIELTAEKSDLEIHILGYYIDWHNQPFRKRLAELQSARVDRIHKMVEKLADHDVKMDAAEVMKLSRHGSVGRLHLARAMLNAGKIRDIREAFSKYIGFLKPCYVSKVKFTPKESIEMVLKVGGVPVLAHPGILEKDEYIPEFIEYGLRGIEVYHTDHKPHQTRCYEEIAARRGLIMTGGSDCHGLGKGRVLLGEIKVAYDTVDALRKEAARIKAKMRHDR